MPRTVHVICFPRDDVVFCSQATAALGSLTRNGRSDGELAIETQAILRATYPGCIVRSRDPLASNWPEQSTWYVYRDGSALVGVGRTSEEEAAGTGKTIDELERDEWRQD